MVERDHHHELIIGVASFAVIGFIARFGFPKWVKDKVFERQGGVAPDGSPIEEYHHVVPERMLIHSKGIAGNNVPENCVGLSSEEHKDVWDKLAAQGVFYPGVTLEQLDPNTYSVIKKYRG